MSQLEPATSPDALRAAEEREGGQRARQGFPRRASPLPDAGIRSPRIRRPRGTRSRDARAGTRRGPSPAPAEAWRSRPRAAEAPRRAGTGPRLAPPVRPQHSPSLGAGSPSLHRATHTWSVSFWMTSLRRRSRSCGLGSHWNHIVRGPHREGVLLPEIAILDHVAEGDGHGEHDLVLVARSVVVYPKTWFLYATTVPRRTALASRSWRCGGGGRSGTRSPWTT